MIVQAIQKGGLIYIYTDKRQTAKTRNGILVGFTGSTVSYRTSVNSKIVIVIDEDMKHVRSYQ